MTISRDLSFLRNDWQSPTSNEVKKQKGKKFSSVQEETISSVKEVSIEQKNVNNDLNEESSSQNQSFSQPQAEHFRKQWQQTRVQDGQNNDEKEPPKAYEIQGRKQAIDTIKRVSQHKDGQTKIDRFV